MRIRDSGWKKFGSGIQDGKNSDPGSRMEKIRIRDKHPGYATLLASAKLFYYYLVMDALYEEELPFIYFREISWSKG
jgi:hypothetical protein